MSTIKIIFIAGIFLFGLMIFVTLLEGMGISSTETGVVPCEHFAGVDNSRIPARCIKYFLNK